ncbi:MAG: DNA-3-methyladenine glycosylase 2 family protein [Peptococcaceae bacterium]|jgi:DNA-3-methyladenine glycosylase II|nr:DNA-3-methyladenine glycosylase 2 family protein [Peptococcaceae bacterium]
MEIFEYGEKEVAYLKKKDKKLGLAIERIGPIRRRVIPDLFEALVNSILSQQISSKAAATVWNRMLERFELITPACIAEASVEDIQQCGTTFRKANYIKDISVAVLSGELNLEELKQLPDQQVIKRLTSLKGIGIWTAEMLLIFSLQRPDVVSWGDLAIRRGMMNLYGLTSLSTEQFARYRQRYSPYGSVASLYLWELAAEPPIKKEPAKKSAQSKV